MPTTANRLERNDEKNLPLCQQNQCPFGLVNSRFAYVAVSRAEYKAQIYTNDSTNLATSLGHDHSKSSALTSVQSLEQIHTTRLGYISVT